MLNTDLYTSSKASAGQLQAVKNELSALTWPREGLVVDAYLIRRESKQAYFDLGQFGTGMVFGLEFMNAREIIRDLESGAKVAAKIVCLDGEDGYIELSLTEASRQRTWQQVQDLLESGEITKVKVVGVNPGGLLVMLMDLRAFLPLSQLSAEHTPKEAAEGAPAATSEELKSFVGQEFNVKVISVNPKKNKLIVSERETISVNMKELLSQYQIGQVVDGMVSGIADFGIFVKFIDNSQIEGLVHISEIDHRIIDNPKEAVQMNEPLKVKIIDIKDGRVFLSLKALKDDPWLKVADKYKAGQEVTGKVYKFNPFGAVVNLDEGLQGVVHVSEFGGVEEMKQAIPLGSTASFLVDSVKTEEKRIVLKVKK